MKKSMIILLGAACLLGGCDTYTGTGAYSGAALGSILGSAIGGIAGGPRGADMGTLVGMAGGAAVGASVGSAADAKAERQRQDDLYNYREYKRERTCRRPRTTCPHSSRYRQDDGRYRYDDGQFLYDDEGYRVGGDRPRYDSKEKNSDSQNGDDRVYDLGIPGPDGK